MRKETARPEDGQESPPSPQELGAGAETAASQARMEAGTADRSESQNTPDGGRIPNPLPDPVRGRREVPEFSISDTGDGRWPPLADTVNLDDFDDIRDAREDDFDIRISDADDFDI